MKHLDRRWRGELLRARADEPSQSSARQLANTLRGKDPMARAFEDFPVGTRLVSTSWAITAEAIVNFAREFDPQVFHLDPQLAEKTLFRGLAASGWHTAAVSMRLFIDTMNVAGGIVGLGVDELKWPNAVRPGDELRVEVEILQARQSKSRAGYGIIRMHNVTKNQRGEVVQSFMANAMLPARSSVS